jgi:hypothetical protein
MNEFRGRLSRAARAVVSVGVATVTCATMSVVATSAAEAAPTVNACGASEVSGVRLSFYPWTNTGFPSLAKHGLVADQALLDAFAREYAANPDPGAFGVRGPVVPNMQDFLVVWLQNRITNIANGAEAAPAGFTLDMRTTEGLGKAQWISHVVGYYAAAWARTNMYEFDRPLLPVPAFNDTVLSALYGPIVDEPHRVVLGGNDAEALAFTRKSLRSNVPAPPPSLAPASGVFATVSPADSGMFGYDAGWLANLLPPGANAPTNTAPITSPYFTADRSKFLDAHFALANLAALTDAEASMAEVQSAGDQRTARLTAAINGGPGEDSLLARQQLFYDLGVANYDRGTSGLGTYYGGWQQPQYDRVLAWASYAVMSNKLNALNALTAVADQDADLSRQQIASTTMWWGYTVSYLSGFLNPNVGDVPFSELLPKFVTKDLSVCQ